MSDLSTARSLSNKARREKISLCFSKLEPTRSADAAHWVFEFQWISEIFALITSGMSQTVNNRFVPDNG